MGLFSCCFAPAPEPCEEPVTQVVRNVPELKQAQEPALKPEPGSDGTPPVAGGEWSRSWGKLNQTETTAVQQTLLKVSELIERFAEGSAEREAPVHALKKALQLVATDCHASYASMSVVSLDQQSFLVMGAVGSSHEAATLPNVVNAVVGSGSSVEQLTRAGSAAARSSSGGGGSDVRAAGAAGAPSDELPPASAGSASGSSAALSWSVQDGETPPSDWAALAAAGIRHIHGMPIRAGPDQLLGVLNLGFKHEPCLDMGAMGTHLFSTYLSLVSATLTAVVRDPGLNAYVCLARDLAAAGSLDALMQSALLGSRGALTRLKGLGGGAGSGTGGSHTWLRLALISGDKSAAALFDDLSQAGVTRTTKRSGSTHGSSAQWVATIQAAGGLVRTNIPMKNTILRIALTNKKQVLIPDVQKLINQLGNVNTDLFASRLLRPPSSVLLLPLRASGVGIFGALYCLADVHTEFSQVAKQLKEVAELLGTGLSRQLNGALAQEYMSIQQLNHEALLAREPGGESGNSLGGLGGPPMGAGHGSGAYGQCVTPASVTPATTAGSLPTGGAASYSTTTTGSSSIAGGGPGGAAARSEGSFMAAVASGGALEFGSTIATHASFGGSMHGSMCSAGGSFSAAGGMLGRSFTTKQVASSTNAVATGITEKLNQKRIDASMAEPEDETLAALQLVAQIGEGGFAKVFRGLYRGLVVAVKVVAVGDPSNERAVMKNAHEIAILRSSSHPNIIQAYSCMTDVHIRDVVSLCTRNAPRQQRVELISALTACAGLRSAGGGGGGQPHHPPDGATCHIEVVEYCDLGNLTSAIRSQVFSLPVGGGGGAYGNGGSHHHSGQRRGALDASGDGSCPSAGSGACTPHSAGGAGAMAAAAAAAAAAADERAPPPGRLRINMRWLLLTLLEVAEGMAYLHRMGVVHCDLKPANVLLKSSNADVRGFTAKVSDFGLSRVEDDDTCATFPFNSCGTAAYVAPEALITTKKVNASVDVYAFGVMMWELFVGQRPYGNMSQQKVVEEVVLRGLRPSFPVGTPLGYAQLAAACWHATANARPTFQEVISRLQSMLHLAEESEAAAAASCSLTGSEAWGGRADGLGTPVAATGAAGMAAAAAAAAAAQQQQLASSSGSRQSERPAIPAGPRASNSSSGGGAGGAGAGTNSAAAAAAIAEAAAVWNKAQAASGSGGGGSSGMVRSPPSVHAQVHQQLQAAQLLQWQQQQAQLQQQQQQQQQQHAARLQSQQQALARSMPDDPATLAALRAGMAAGPAYGQQAGAASPPPQQQQQQSAYVHASMAAAAASGSVYEFQQVGFGGESVVGTGAVGGGRFAGAHGLAAHHQLLQQAAAVAAAGYGVGAAGHGQLRRPPARSKTFTAGSSMQQQYDQLVAAATAAAAAAAAGGAGAGDHGSAGTDASGSASGATSLSFGNYAGSGGGGGGAPDLRETLQQQLLMQHRQQLLMQQQQQPGYMAAVGLLAAHGQQQAFTFSRTAGGGPSPGTHRGLPASAAALEQAAAQQQQQAMAAHAAAAPQGTSGPGAGTWN